MKFKVGDVVELVFVQWPENQHLVGREFVINEVGVMGIHKDAPYIGYVLNCLDQHVVQEEQLRLKRPPFEACDEEFHDWIRKTLKVSA